MKKWDNKYWNAIIVFLFLCVCIYGSYCSNRNVAHIEKHGVWTIYEIGSVRYHSKGGKQAPMFFSFRGERFRDGVYLGEHLRVGEKGLRFFMMLMPEKPTKHFTTLDPVPSWFTLEAPAEGWPTKPTEAELREMMVQDSLKRGLITNTAVPPDDL